MSRLLSHRWLAFLLWAVAFLFASLIPVCFVHGFPLPLFESPPLRIKGIRKLFELFFVFFASGFVFHPDQGNLLIALKKKAESLAASKLAIGLLAGIYFLLFLWEQATRYFSLEINFLPFLFYDYMLWFFDQGRFCYTGLLHGFYHVNLSLLLLYPFWKIFQSPWVLHVAHPLLAVSAAIPFYYWTRDQLKNPLLAWVAAFVYLNFRFLQNVLSVNFAVEIFYPVFVFSAVYFAARRWNGLYYLTVFLGLAVKEDSTVYFGTLGLVFLLNRADWKRGFWTLILCVLYPLFVLKCFLPWSGSPILGRDFENYLRFGNTPSEISHHILRSPWLFAKELFFPFEKVKTLLKLNSKLLFLPLFSPWFIAFILSIYPTFFQGGEFFNKLAFYYGAPVLPFLFLAFVDGWKRVRKVDFFQKRPSWVWGMAVLLIFLNGLNFRPLHFTKDDLKTLALARGIPRNAVVTTQGHLLPYVGYRKRNFYISWRYAKRKDTREDYTHPDYYLFDFKANAYPDGLEELRKMADQAKANPHFKVIYEDHRRLLLGKQ